MSEKEFNTQRAKWKKQHSIKGHLGSFVDGWKIHWKGRLSLALLISLPFVTFLLGCVI